MCRHRPVHGNRYWPIVYFCLAVFLAAAQHALTRRFHGHCSSGDRELLHRQRLGSDLHGMVPPLTAPFIFIGNRTQCVHAVETQYIWFVCDNRTQCVHSLKKPHMLFVFDNSTQCVHVVETPYIVFVLDKRTTSVHSMKIQHMLFLCDNSTQCSKNIPNVCLWCQPLFVARFSPLTSPNLVCRPAPATGFTTKRMSLSQQMPHSSIGRARSSCAQKRWSHNPRVRKRAASASVPPRVTTTTTSRIPKREITRHDWLVCVRTRIARGGVVVKSRRGTLRRGAHLSGGQISRGGGT